MIGENGQRSIILIALLVVIAVAFVASATALDRQNLLRPETVLPLRLVLGVLLVVAALGSYALVLKQLGVQADGKHALGLPEGSIRAVLALMLVLTFVATSAYLFFQLQSPGTEVSQGLTLDQVGALPANQIIRIEPVPNSSPVLVNVTIERATDASSRIADQLVTVLATLLTAVVSFYFATASLKDARVGSGGRTT
jgi:lysylphosphatidylglycerol synthetase-like protein (DUF2156 family)